MTESIHTTAERSTTGWLFRLAALTLLFAAAALLSYSFLASTFSAATIAPHVGLALAGILLCPRRYRLPLAVWLALVDVAVSLFAGQPLTAPSVIQSLTTVGQAFAAACLLTRFLAQAPDFERLNDVLKLAIWGAALPLAAFSLPAAMVAEAYYGTPLLEGWAWRLIASGLGVMTVTPLVLIVCQPALLRLDRLSTRHWIELGLLLTAVAMTTSIVFTGDNPAGSRLASFSYLPFIFLVTIAIRLGPQATIFGSAIFCASAIGIDAMAVSMLPAEARSSVISLEIFLLVMVTVSLTLAAVVAERKNESRRLRQSREQLRNLIAMAPLGIYVADREKYRFTNAAGAALVGLADPSEIVGKDVMTYYPEDGRDAARQRIDQLLANGGTQPRIENAVVDAQGNRRLVEAMATAFQWEGRPAFLVMVSDITERKQAEDAMRRMQRMDAIGQLTGGIAHDFNNLLGIILGNLELIEELAEDRPDISNRLGMSIRAVDRGIAITSKLLGMSRRQHAQLQTVSLNELILSVQDLIARSLTASISFESALAPDLWSVTIDPGDFQDALVNLSLNARDAMPKGGTLTVETENRCLDGDYASVDPAMREGDYVVVSVRDTGIGMTPEVRERAFDPFFSTKDAGRGTGLGLSMVYGFVQRSKGHITIETEPDGGTTIRILLPRAGEAVAAASARAQPDPEALPGGTDTILIVDDERDILDIAASRLQGMGYSTLTAGSAREALDILAKNESIDLLFSDVVMPGSQDGYALAIAAREMRPHLKVLLTSGYTQHREQSLGADNGFVAHLTRTRLQKPYRRDDLAKAIRKALDGNGGE